MRATRLAVLLAALTLLSWPAPAATQPLALYDDFSGGDIDSTRWLGYEHRISSTRYIARPFPDGIRDDAVPADAPSSYLTFNEESSLHILDGQAQITLTTRGPNFRDTDYRNGVGRSGLRVNHVALADGSPRITRMQATVTVAAVSVDLCSPDGGRIGPAAQIFGHFFNDGSSTGPGDLTGDVFATLERRGGSSGVFGGSIARCLTADCSWIRQLGYVEFTRPSALAVAYTFTITWQPTQNGIAFAVTGGGGSIESHRLTYGVPDAAPPRGYAYDLRVENTPATCWGPPETRRAERWSIDARFDNVRFDSTAVAATR